MKEKRILQMFLDSKGERKVIKNKIIKVQDILITVRILMIISVLRIWRPRKGEIQEQRML